MILLFFYLLLYKLEENIVLSDKILSVMSDAQNISACRGNEGNGRN